MRPTTLRCATTLTSLLRDDCRALSPNTTSSQPSSCVTEALRFHQTCRMHMQAALCVANWYQPQHQGAHNLLLAPLKQSLALLCLQSHTLAQPSCGCFACANRVPVPHTATTVTHMLANMAGPQAHTARSITGLGSTCARCEPSHHQRLLLLATGTCRRVGCCAP